MTRNLRPDSTGSFFHVMNRGAARQPIFLTRRDGAQFLALLRDGSTKFGVEISAFCLMGNHYHLLVRCPDGGLSEFMHFVASHYARYFNDRLGRDGPIFRARFHAIKLDSEAYIKTVARYIHRNPLDIQPPVRLDEYQWSSLRFYAGKQRPPSWLRTDVVPIDPDDIPDAAPWDWAIGVAVDELGDQSAETNSLARTVALTMLDQAGPADRARLDGWLTFPSAAARRQAIWRARQRVDSDPTVASIARRALAIAA